MNSNSEGERSLISPNSLFFSPPISRQVPKDVAEDIEEFYKDCKAISHYLLSSLKKIFTTLKRKDENRVDMLALAFQRFQEGILCSKSESITNIFKKKMLLKMKNKRQLTTKRKQEKQQYLMIYQRAKTSLIYYQWKKIVKIQKCQRFFYKKRREDLGKEIMMFLRENLQRKMVKKLSVHGEGISQFYANSILVKSFKGFQINRKISKFNKTLKNHYFPIVLDKIKDYNRHSKRYTKNRSKYLKSACFSFWKYQYQTKKATLFHENYLIRSSFLRWSSILDYLVTQNQIEKENYRIVSLFRDRCESNKLSRIFSRWRLLSQEGKRWRRQSQILNRCAEAKFIETLLRKYFLKLKAHRLFNKIRSNYYEVKLKRKVLDSLKYSLISSVQRQEKLFAFLQRRTLSKYFSRIKRFNRQQFQKVQKFRQLRAFKAFTFTIVYQYFLNKKKAVQYHSRNILFKSLFALKNERSQRIKEQLCILKINLAMPLRRWYRGYNIRGCVIRKNWLRIKAIIRQWRLLVIRRQSNNQLVRQFQVEQSGSKQEQEETFQFQNIMATIAKIKKAYMLQKSTNEIGIVQQIE